MTQSSASQMAADAPDPALAPEVIDEPANLNRAIRGRVLAVFRGALLPILASTYVAARIATSEQTPVHGLANHPFVALVGVALAGLIAMIGCMSLAELRSTNPLDGTVGVWYFARFLKGPRAGLFVGWLEIMANIATVGMCMRCLANLGFGYASAGEFVAGGAIAVDRAATFGGECVASFFLGLFASIACLGPIVTGFWRVSGENDVNLQYAAEESPARYLIPRAMIRITSIGAFMGFIFTLTLAAAGINRMDGGAWKIALDALFALCLFFGIVFCIRRAAKLVRLLAREGLLYEKLAQSGKGLLHLLPHTITLAAGLLLFTCAGNSGSLFAAGFLYIAVLAEAALVQVMWRGNSNDDDTFGYAADLFPFLQYAGMVLMAALALWGYFGVGCTASRIVVVAALLAAEEALYFAYSRHRYKEHAECDVMQIGDMIDVPQYRPKFARRGALSILVTVKDTQLGMVDFASRLYGKRGPGDNFIAAINVLTSKKGIRSVVGRIKDEVEMFEASRDMLATVSARFAQFDISPQLFMTVANTVNLGIVRTVQSSRINYVLLELHRADAERNNLDWGANIENILRILRCNIILLAGVERDFCYRKILIPVFQNLAGLRFAFLSALAVMRGVEGAEIEIFLPTSGGPDDFDLSWFRKQAAKEGEGAPQVSFRSDVCAFVPDGIIEESIRGAFDAIFVGLEADTDEALQSDLDACATVRRSKLPCAVTCARGSSFRSQPFK